MVAIGIKPGDRVITTPLTWIASASAAAVLGAEIDFVDVGFNFRMTDTQAAVGSEQLKKLDHFNDLRNDNARYLTEQLQEIPGLLLPSVPAGYKHTFHLYLVQIDEKKFGISRADFIYNMLYQYGIKVGTHYPPLHTTRAFTRRVPAAEAAAERLATLPLNPRQNREQLDYLAQAIRQLARVK